MRRHKRDSQNNQGLHLNPIVYGGPTSRAALYFACDAPYSTLYVSSIIYSRKSNADRLTSNMAALNPMTSYKALYTHSRQTDWFTCYYIPILYY
jgi:hypothetical protein